MSIRHLLFILLAFVAQLKAIAEVGDSLIRFVGRGTLVELEDDAFNRDWLLGSRVQTINQEMVGRIRLSSGQRLQTPLWLRFRKDSLGISVHRVHQRTTRGQSERWMLLPAERSNSGLWRTDIAPLMACLHAELDPVAGRMLPAKPTTDVPQLNEYYSHGRGLELSITQTFVSGLSVKLRHSLYLLPKEPMPARVDDARVGYYTTQTKAGNKSQLSINRYRVDSGQRITFWIDPRFPKLWQEGIKQGVEDWNAAFERIGLGSVLKAKLYPESPASAFDPDAMTVNTIRYVESSFPNAQGKHWCDPRSGEIIQSDVLLYSSVRKLLHKWYYLQTAAYNPLARSNSLPDSVERRLVRYATAHEIGHCLGLEHNYRASASFSTDSLRSPAFTARYGTTPSIMDYARLNDVAQPGDGVLAVYPPLLGDYDAYAVAYGYAKVPADSLRRLVDEAQSNPLLRYEKASIGGLPDPSTQPAGLGDDPLLSTGYALQNLRYILRKHKRWGMTAISEEDIAEAYYAHLFRLAQLLEGRYRHTLSADGKEVREEPTSPEVRQAAEQALRISLAEADTLFAPFLAPSPRAGKRKLPHEERPAKHPRRHQPRARRKPEPPQPAPRLHELRKRIIELLSPSAP